MTTTTSLNKAPMLVIGAGIMGAGIAQVAAQAACTVTVVRPSRTAETETPPPDDTLAADQTR